ncbi:MAG: hypothetical protein HONBIEJF_02970 [Fimbriimonadaceae bacterium]|nr:hypothetical protein [Fimbriimonadaceae bacterium]
MSIEAIRDRVGVARHFPRTPTSVAQAEVIVPKAFVTWGVANLILSNIAMLIPFYWDNGPILRNATVVSGVLWIIIGSSRLNVPLRVALPIALVLFLQIWSAISTGWIASAIGRDKAINAADFFLLRYLYLYFTASMLVWLEPKTRRIILGIILVNVGTCGVIAIAQFLKFPPAIELANILSPTVDITNWDNRGGLRATGIYGFPGHLALNAAICAAIFAGRLTVRKLSRIEVFLFFTFAFFSIIPQARTHIPVLALTMLVFVLGMIYQERERASWFIVMLVIGVISVAFVFKDQFSYVAGTDWLNDKNMQYRQKRSWVMADKVHEAFPWTGIGPEPRYWGRPDSLPDKYAPRTAFDNGYMLIRSSYGIVGMASVILALFIGVFLALNVRLDRHESGERRSLATTWAIACVGVAIGMYGNNVITWEPTMTFMMMLAGASMTTRVEAMESSRSKLKTALRGNILPANR